MKPRASRGAPNRAIKTEAVMNRLKNTMDRVASPIRPLMCAFSFFLRAMFFAIGSGLFIRQVQAVIGAMATGRKARKIDDGHFHDARDIDGGPAFLSPPDLFGLICSLEDIGSDMRCDMRPHFCSIGFIRAHPPSFNIP